MAIFYQHYISRLDVRKRKNCIFVFGDNLARRGFGGQAKEMRGEPNTIGIPTKKFPSNSKTAFFQDSDFDMVEPILNQEFERLEKYYKDGLDIVLPMDGIGTGLAALPVHAPRIHRYISYRILILGNNNSNMYGKTKREVAILLSKSDSEKRDE